MQALNEELATTTEELAAANEEIRAANEELSESNHQLQATNVDLDNFIYTASHDLKAPISNIEGLLQALLAELPPQILASERVGRITSLMGESVERFKKTLVNLTEVVKLQKDNSGEAVSVDLSEVVREVLLDLQPQIASSGARLEVNLTGCPTISFSGKNARSVVYNLLSNALKYGSPQRVPLVQVDYQMTEEYLMLSVADNGLGMDLSRDRKLFSMFRRLRDHVEGSGLGLYMVKKILENAGGKIEVDSKEGEGSAFRVYFRR